MQAHWITNLRGWRRIGIVASVAWACGAYVYVFNHETNAGHEAFRTSYSICADAHPLPTEAVPDRGPYCSERAKSFANATHFDHARENAIVVALLPIPFAWLAAYLLVLVFRWIKRGFAST